MSSVSRYVTGPEDSSLRAALEGRLESFSMAPFEAAVGAGVAVAKRSAVLDYSELKADFVDCRIEARHEVFPCMGPQATVIRTCEYRDQKASVQLTKSVDIHPRLWQLDELSEWDGLPSDLSIDLSNKAGIDFAEASKVLAQSAKLIAQAVGGHNSSIIWLLELPVGHTTVSAWEECGGSKAICTICKSDWGYPTLKLIKGMAWTR